MGIESMRYTLPEDLRFRLGFVDLYSNQPASPDFWLWWKEMMGHLIICDVVNSGIMDVTRYLCFSPLFDVMEEGEPIPLYEFVFVKDDEGKAELKKVEKVPSPYEKQDPKLIKLKY